MAEPGKIATASAPASSTPQFQRTTYRVKQITPDKMKGPRLGDYKQVSLPNGWNLGILHRRVRGNINEYYVSASKYGFKPVTNYSQYVNDGSYPGAYSTVKASKDDAWDDIKKWMKELR